MRDQQYENSRTFQGQIEKIMEFQGHSRTFQDKDKIQGHLRTFKDRGNHVGIYGTKEKIGDKGKSTTPSTMTVLYTVPWE